MSRNLKRVPVSFDWPRGKTWGGYLNPYYDLAIECPDCVHGYDRAGGRPDANAALFHDQWHGQAPFDPIAYGAEVLPLTQDHPAYHLAKRNIEQAPSYYVTRSVGFNSALAIEREAWRLHALWRYQWSHHLIQADVEALVVKKRLMDFTHTWSKKHGWQKRTDDYHPNAIEVNLWSYSGLGHDGINKTVCVRARCLRENVPYGCGRCSGEGRIWPTPTIKQNYETWKKEDPPTGEGYQLWEDCSEGSPISPVFTTLEALCTWCEKNATTFADFKATKAEWLEMLDGGIVHAKTEEVIFL